MSNKILIITLVVALIVIAAVACVTLKRGEEGRTNESPVEPIATLGEGIVVNNDGEEPSSPMDLVLLSTPFTKDKVATISVKVGKRVGYPTEKVNWPNTKAEIILPKGLELVEGDLSWQGNIVKDDIVEFSAKVKAIRDGEWKIEAYAKYIIDEINWFGDRETLYILVTNGEVLISEKPFTPVEPEEEAETIK